MIHKIDINPRANSISICQYLGHLTSGDVNVPSEHIADCITKFLLCTDTQSGMDLINSRDNCYQDFQSCSGLKIEISEGTYTMRYFCTKNYNPISSKNFEISS